MATLRHLLVFTVGLLTLWSCQARLPSQTLASRRLAPTSLHLSVEQPATRGYRAAYIERQDWSEAQAVLSNPSLGVSQTVAASASTDPASGTRGASLAFPALQAGSGYALTVSARRRNASGGLDTIASGTLAELTLAPGPNTLSVPMTAQGRLTIALPAASFASVHVTTFAGNVSLSVTDGAGATAHINRPETLIVDTAGTVYVADVEGSCIRTVAPDGTVRTLAGTGVQTTADGPVATAGLDRPSGLVLDAAGNLLFSNSGNQIRKVTSSGMVVSLVGGAQGYQDGTSNARFGWAYGMALDASGTLYVADGLNNCIRKMTPDGTVSTLAGGNGTTANPAGYQDGAGTGARFSDPRDVAVDAAGFVYVVDAGNNCVRKIGPDGTVSTLAGGDGTTANGYGYLDGPGASARFASPWGLAIDAAGAVYVADMGNSCIRRIAPDGTVSTVAGGDGTTLNGAGHQDGPLATARLGNARDVAIDGDGILYVADYGNNRIRKIVRATDTISTLAGNGQGRYRDGTGLAALFSFPDNLCYGGDGNLYVSDGPGGRQIRRLTPGGLVSTLASDITSGGGFAWIGGLAADASGDVYAAAGLCIRKVTAAGAVSIWAGGSGVTENPAGYVDGPAANARFRALSGLARDASGQIYVTDRDDHCIRKVAPDGTVSTLAGGDGTTLNGAGYQDGPGASARFNGPEGLAVDPAGYVYVADTLNYCVRRIAPDGTVSTLAGGNGVTANSSGYLDGAGSNARFGYMKGLTMGANGLVYVADDGNRRVRRVAPDGSVSTLAGSSYGYQDGAGGGAAFRTIAGVATDPNGNVYVADTWNHVIRRIR